MKNEKTKTSENKPEQKFRCGNVTATIWKKEMEKDGKTFDVYNVEITKNYTDKDKKWNKTNNFGKDDLQKVLIVTAKAQEFLYMNEDSE